VLFSTINNQSDSLIFCIFNGRMTALKKYAMRFGRFCRTKIGIILMVITAVVLTAFYFSLPRTLFPSPTSFVIEDRQGELLGAAIAADGQWRFPLMDSIPDKFVKCIVAFEDKRFWYHPGVDPAAMARAVMQNLAGDRIVSGGSTLSMQVIRMSRNKPRTIGQKPIEAFLA